MSPLEYLQYLLLVAMSWVTPSGDLYEAACLGTHFFFREYHEGLCPARKSWDEVGAELDYEFFYPPRNISEPYPLVILVHGTSSAHTLTMKKRRDFFLQQGYAVLIPDSFTEARVKAGLPLSLRKEKIYAPGVSAPEAFTGARVSQTQMQLFQQRVTEGYAFLPAVRAADVFLSLEVARSNSMINPDTISIIGYSHGASAVLEALTLAKLGMPVPGVGDIPDASLPESIRSIVLYYPSCRPGHYFSWYKSWPQVPTLMILGSEDSQCRAKNCQHVNRIINQQAGFSLIKEVVYKAHHNFDMSEYPLDYRKNLEEKALTESLHFLRNH
ncbi:dienelactone hydrolase family protein [Sansalvadorimonas verongulae]|uniref:dienelactone hydrolase family protein n=1 Tax=Sansalvadorimonas verongulae TaxID=2172824 RepID=UPI0012BBF4A3|nr:dienelactone hydrolase family protein [Sansalvadorimonas verongulae]MTI15504.1 hypothetical protein [Sansalvadorimonas verongulae]